MNFGDVLLARLPFPDGGGFKLRPVLVIHEYGDGDLLVVPVTTHDPRGAIISHTAQSHRLGRSKKVPAAKFGKLASCRDLVARTIAHDPVCFAKVAPVPDF